MKINRIILSASAILMFGLSAQAKSYKRGVSENAFQYKAQMEVLAPGVTWCYSWGTSLGNYIADQQYLEFVPMCWNGVNASQIRSWCQAHPETKYILGFNEPNFKSQANMTPQQAAERWPELVSLARELGLQIVAPALNYSPDAPYTDPARWMDEFVALVGLDSFDFTAIHNYGGLDVMKGLATNFHNKYGKPVWVTEFCYWPGEMGDVPVASQAASMIETVEWLEKTEWIYRYAWFKALGENRANYKLVESGRGEDPRELSELGKIYLYMSEFDGNVYHPVNEVIPATEYIARQFTGVGCTNDPNAPLPIEISSFASGASLDYQFDVPTSEPYNLVLTVTGVGEPTRWDPNIKIVKVNSDGSDGETLLNGQSFTLPGNETDYKTVALPINLTAGKQTIRLKDNAPYTPSGLRFSTVKLVSVAGVEDVAVDKADELVDVYNLQGMLLRQGVTRVDALNDLPAGIYIVGNKKVIVK